MSYDILLKPSQPVTGLFCFFDILAHGLQFCTGLFIVQTSVIGVLFDFLTNDMLHIIDNLGHILTFSHLTY